MMAGLVGKASVAETIIGNCMTTIPVKFDLDGADTGPTVVIGPTGKGMSAQ